MCRLWWSREDVTIPKHRHVTDCRLSRVLRARGGCVDFTTNEGSLLTRWHSPQAVPRLVSETQVSHTHFLIFTSVFWKPLFLVTVYLTGGQPFQTHFPPNQLVAASQTPFKPHLHPLSLSQKIRVWNISLRGSRASESSIVVFCFNFPQLSLHQLYLP